MYVLTLCKVSTVSFLAECICVSRRPQCHWSQLGGHNVVYSQEEGSGPPGGNQGELCTDTVEVL